MLTAPRQNWPLYEILSEKENAQWVRSLSPQDRFAIYEDLFNVIWAARSHHGDWVRLDK